MTHIFFAEDFVNNTISLLALNLAMQLGNLGEQVVLLSEKAFRRIEFIEYTVADYREYYYKRAARDKKTRKRCGLTQKELAVKSGVSLNTIRAYEHKSKNLSKAQFNIIMRLTKTLKCDASDLTE